MSNPVQVRLLTEEDEKNLQFLLDEYPHKKTAEAIRDLLARNRQKHEEGNSKDQRLERLEEGQDAMREQLDCIQALIQMLLWHNGIGPLEGKSQISAAEIPGCLKRDK